MTEPDAAPAPVKSKTPWWAYVVGLGILVAIGLTVSHSTHTTPTPADEVRDAKRACQEKFIPDRLKAPATAKFSNVTATDAGGSYRIEGSVDSENGFGALVRSSFSCVIHSSGDQWVLDSASVQG